MVTPPQLSTNPQIQFKEEEEEEEETGEEQRGWGGRREEAGDPSKRNPTRSPFFLVLSLPSAPLALYIYRFKGSEETAPACVTPDNEFKKESGTEAEEH